MASRGSQLIREDSELAELVGAWERALDTTCTPAESDLGGQRAAVFCGDSNVLAVFDNASSQQEYKENFVALKGSGPGPDTVVEGDGWSAFVMEEDAAAVRDEMGGQGSRSLGSTSTDSRAATPSSESSARAGSGDAGSPDCPSVRKADSTVEVWNLAMQAQGTERYDILMATIRAGAERQKDLDAASGVSLCPGVERAKYNYQVATLELAELSPGGITREDLEKIADAGNEWLTSIGRTDLEFEMP